jgi:integration host factor subunit beta
MNRSDLIERLWASSKLPRRAVDLAVSTMLEHMVETPAAGERIELRGFGSFSLHYRAAQVWRNPKTGHAITVPDKYMPHFRPGKTLRKRVDGGSQER